MRISKPPVNSFFPASTQINDKALLDDLRNSRSHAENFWALINDNSIESNLIQWIDESESKSH